MPSKKESRPKTLDDYLSPIFPEELVKRFESAKPIVVVTAAQVRAINRELEPVIRQNQAEYQAGLDEGLSQIAR